MTLPFAYLVALYWMMRRLQRQQFQDDDNTGGHGRGKSNGGILRNSNQCDETTFDDVAGIESSLQELSEIVSYARNPSAFRAVGARPPRGVLLYGVPGCGKTLLARAIAGEANREIDGVHRVGGNAVDCFAVCSGSEFVETFVGRGAARVRTLFHNVREEAKRNFRRRHGGRERVARYAADPVSDRLVGGWESIKSILGMTDLSKKDDDSHRRPMAIIFIDEIDCLAKRRDGSGFSSSLGRGCDEREQTLNQLLTELDGFETGAVSSDGVDVIVIAATNRPEVLDPAIMRPGRFDRHVRISLPDARGRDAILRVHARDIRWDELSVDFSILSKSTQGFSGADLKNVINEAALLAVRSGCLMVEQIHLLEAVQKVRANLSA
jgi:cell division protease FtsH